MITDDELKAMKAALSRGRVFDWRWDGIGGTDNAWIEVERSFDDWRNLEFNDYVKEQIIVAMNGFPRLVEEVERLREWTVGHALIERTAELCVKILTAEIKALRSENAALLAEVAELKAGAK